jgi:hypothetical protein
MRQKLGCVPDEEQLSSAQAVILGILFGCIGALVVSAYKSGE